MARHVVNGEFCPSPALLKRARAVMKKYTPIILRGIGDLIRAEVIRRFGPTAGR